MTTSDVRPVHLCLVAHCLSTPVSEKPQAHPELFLQGQDLSDLLDELANDGFRFVLPTEPDAAGQNTCSVTFDDGYANNAMFLPIAERFGVPFVLFVASLNIAQQLPFLWDAKSVAGEKGWRHWSDDYREAYRGLADDVVQRLLGDDNHRPFTMTEFETFAAHPLTHLALHTHSHQPPVGRFLSGVAREIEENQQFLRPFPRTLLRDLALPCGLYTPWTGRRILATGVDRIYTCDGGGAQHGGPIIHRISLVSPSVRGSLMTQVRRALAWQVRLRRQVANFRYSSTLLNRL